MQTRQDKRARSFFVMTIFLIIIIVFCISGTVKARGNGVDRGKQQYLHKMEQEYLIQLKGMLLEEGYKNSGITLTKVDQYLLSQDQNQATRQYTVSIYHRRIQLLSNTEQEQLRKQIAQIQLGEQRNSLIIQL